MILFLKTLVLFVLIIPAFFLASIIWLFGGWTQGWDYMPNPLSALFEWTE